MNMKFLVYSCEIILFLAAIIAQDPSWSTNQTLVDADLKKYFKSLDKILNFFVARKIYVDIIVNFGLFILNVNLKRLLGDKGSRLPAFIKNDLNKLLVKSDHLINYLKLVKEHNTKPDDVYRTLSELFSNEALWIKQIENFHLSNITQNNYAKDYLRELYPSWDNFIKVNDPWNSIPTPEESDMCLAKISRNPINTSPRTHSVKCDLPEDCHQSVLYGTDHGYALTHRLLFLQVARYARRCYVISELEDTKLRNKFCSLCYRECLYISMNEFQDIDLFLEHIYFCSLEGHSQFIRRRWLAKIIKSQTREGCFPDSLDYKKNIRSGRIGDDDGTKINKRFSILGGRCNAHTTSLAAGVLAAAVRFILETFY